MPDGIKITCPADPDQFKALRAGDKVLLSGRIITGRDAAHKRLAALVREGRPLPVELNNQVIYYVGPAPAPLGRAVGSAGPTTSYRMDSYTPLMLEQGLKGMIGKGLRSSEVIEAMKKHGAVYFGAVGGAAALISRSIVKSEVIAYEDLGAEAIHAMQIVDFPAIVIIDSLGGNLYETEPPKFRISAQP